MRKIIALLFLLPSLSFADGLNGSITPAASNITGTLGVADGGTGQTNFTAGNILFGNGPNGVNTTSTFTVSGSGNIGVGTSIPATTLDVFGSAQFGNGVNKSTFTAGGQGQIFGTATNDSAAAGYFGEFASSTLGAPQTPAATTAYVALSTITLTAGDWDVEATCQINTGATTAGTEFDCGISNADTSIDASNLNNICGSAATLTVSVNSSCEMGPRRISLAGSTSFFLVGELKFTVLGGATWTTNSMIRARRVR